MGACQECTAPFWQREPVYDEMFASARVSQQTKSCNFQTGKTTVSLYIYHIKISRELNFLEQTREFSHQQLKAKHWLQKDSPMAK